MNLFVKVEYTGSCENRSTRHRGLFDFNFSGSQEERGAEEAERQGQALQQDQGDEGGRGARKGKNIIVFGHIEYCNIIGIIHQMS